MSGIHEEVQSEGGTSRRPPLVLHVVIALDGGGLERLVVDWTNARNERWPGSTWICCLDRPGALAAEVRDEAVASIHARRGRFPFDVAAVRRLRCMYGQRQKSAAGANPPLVVHSHNTAAQQYATLALVGRGIPHVHTEHGTNPHFGGWLQRLRNVWMTRATDCVVAVSEDTADALVRDQRIRVAVLHHHVDPLCKLPGSQDVEGRMPIALRIDPAAAVARVVAHLWSRLVEIQAPGDVLRLHRLGQHRHVEVTV